METRIEIRAANDLSEEERKELDWLWDVEEPDYVWSEANWLVLTRVDDRVVSKLSIIERVCLVDGQRVKLGGIGDVITVPSWRGHGFASSALREAAAFMCQELGVEFGLLICAEYVVSFYSQLEWKIVEGPLVFDQPGGRVISPLVTMVLPCGEKEWPKGMIDLCGLPW